MITLCAAIVLGAALIAFSFALNPSRAPNGDPNAAAYASLGGPFRMIDQEGRAVDQGVLKGKWSAVFFGFVTCPDICPVTLQALAQTQEKLGADAARFQTVFVSVDPKRDSPALIKTYLDQPGYPPHALGLTGTPDQAAAIAKAYRVYFAYTPRSEKDGGGYDVSHSGAIYLVNPKGVTVGTLIEAMGPAAMAEQIQKAMRAGA